MQAIQAAIKRKPKKERVYLRVGKGILIPADPYAASQLRQKGYKMDDVLAATLVKLNNPKFHRLIHRIGQLCAKNIDAFYGMGAHQVLKRIQLEADIFCEPLAIVMPCVGMVTVKLPQSLSFEEMDDGERHEIARAMCRHIAKQYWKTLTPEQIEEMAESFVEEV